MKLGIFDSGLGGLAITKSIRDALPDIDIIYFGDTLHLPYGNRSEDTIYLYTQRCMEYLFQQDCKLIIIACNTASASALRRLQQEWLPKNHPDRNIIGVIVPTLEAALDAGCKKIGLIATNHTITSDVYTQELGKIDPSIQMIGKATPLLVPLIENDGMKWAPGVLEDYLQPLLEQKIECLILGCTHYVCLKDILGPLMNGVKILSQDDIIPQKLAYYLTRHPEYSDAISRNACIEFRVSDVTDNYCNAARAIYGADIQINKAILPA
ncbi:MAG: glutamate racemase [Alphaproteobacteria bacterium]